MDGKIRRIAIEIFIFMVSLSVFRLVQAAEPLQLVRTSVDKAVQILRDPNLQSQDKKSERINRLREALHSIFDYEEMAKRALGTHWRRRTPAEQKEFVKLFRDFLERIYSDKIDFYGGEEVRFGREFIDKGFAEVESTLIKPKGEELAVVYKLRQRDGQWKVYDAVVENISIINNYRSQFDRVISRSSYEELVKRLQEKTGQDG
ncbi:MAG TPA: ABC transporter substrate-binding protein [Terriglobales bacterium]|nr:ABC transporter substrate-binding protein [Terriglobales bacterium]